MSSYCVAPIFVIRAAGVPFEHLDRLSTRESSALARELLLRETEAATARAAAEKFLSTPTNGLSADVSRLHRAALKSGQSAAAPNEPYAREIQSYLEASSLLRAVTHLLDETLARELHDARAHLYKSSREVLPGYLVFGAGEFRERLEDLANEDETLPARNSRVRERERHLLLYLQRVCGKNDTFSEFGPSAWGTVAEQPERMRMAPRAGVQERCAFLERWTAHTLAAAINDDPDTRSQLAPRVNRNGRFENGEFVLNDTGERWRLSVEEADVVMRANGRTSAASLGVRVDSLEQLAARRIVLWQMEVPALEPEAFAILVSDIRDWEEGPARTKWLERAERIAALPQRFSVATKLAERSALMSEARGLLDELGARQTSQRSLYAAANPIAEECYRETHFSVSQQMADELGHDIEPWVNLWRDTYAFVASRVAEGLRGLLREVPVQNGGVSLPAFLAHCANQKLPLTGHGIVALAHLAFQEVKTLFRQTIATRTDAAEWQMTAEDLAFVRTTLDYPKFGEYTYPSADLQISATSAAAIERGEYEWIVSELHPPIAIMHHALYWSCPDKAALSHALAGSTFDQPNAHYGFFAADFTAHTAVRQMDALPDLTTFVAAQRCKPDWRSVSPSDVEVYADDTTGDVCMRRRGSHDYLGSFARAWIIPLGFHPFTFTRAPYTPRLRCGRAIVQRRSWTVGVDEFALGKSSGVSPALVRAVEQLRAAKGWPRFIYIRPTEQALRRSGAEGRDKDTKPVFVDLESYLFLEIFQRWLVKAGELEVTEMLPDPEHLCWQEADGRRTFELRTLIVPRA